MQFTQKYAIVQFLEDVPAGAEFLAGSWPLHVTIADTFAIDWDRRTMTKKLTGLLENHSQVASRAGEDGFFGEDGHIQVTLIEKTADLANLHHDVIELLEQGGWKPNDPQFSRAGFIPHATVQTQKRLNRGDRVVFLALSVIDFFPREDPYRRKVLATINIG